ncbi:MAG: cellulase family glycosylhydrolase [Verrucomicrobia bacterium]|nr:cellulase family glycosylhydrolase [Verrucomicrobiota bacterium]
MIRLLASLITASVLCVTVSLDAAENILQPKKPQPLPPASAKKLPRWRGFNLLEKFQVGSRKPFIEEDFELISELGFNFVRLPMDYRCWIKDKDWEKFDEEQLKEIDQAVEWGGKYGIHVWINFHRAPGYTVAKPKEATDLFTDAKTQEVCAKHWAEFARRYKGIPNTRLGFNLFNEPAGVDTNAYVTVVRKIVGAIRAEDPKRLIISDGLQWGQNPIYDLRDLGIAQAARGYSPSELTHYKASWVRGENFPLPAWPKMLGPNGTLLSPSKKEGSHPLVIDGPFTVETALRLHVLGVSSRALLVVEADGAKLWEKDFKTGPGQGEWKKSEFKPQYKIHFCTYDSDYTVTVPARTKQVKLFVAGGDWLQMSELGLKPAGAEREDVLQLPQKFSEKPDPIHYVPGARGTPFVGMPMQDRAWLWQKNIVPWKKIEAKGVGVMVGEWGSYNKTPHDVVLRWAEDCLANWKRAGWGWAMWNFRGSFGILDSERKDVTYEDFHGHKLDRKLLDLLQKY